MLPFPHETQKPLKEVCTLGVGGPARYFTEVKTKERLQEIFRYCHEKGLPFLIIGKGSNCLFDDRGYGGVVIQNKIDYLQHEQEIVKAGSGFSFARLGTITAREGWTGLEFAAGIPATVGGAIFMNAGANQQEISQVLQSVEFMEADGSLVHLSREEITFSYRYSSFYEKKGAIVEGTFRLQRAQDAKEKQKSLLDYRLKTQPYGDKSAGCAFRNPAGNAAGKLIEQCGLKGLKVGGAEVSLKHANFVVNMQGASSQDIIELMKVIKEKVFQETGIVLEQEIRYIPYEG